MEVNLIAYTPSPDWVCAKAAGICTRRGPSVQALRAAMKSGHTSVIEHASFTFEIRGISRVTLAQLTRHRHASYSVESQRYNRVEDLTACAVVPESFAVCGVDVRPLLAELQHMYEMLIASGVPQEDARYVLPEGTATSLILTMNARELRHFFSLRCCNRAQWEIRELANRMRILCRSAAPELFKKCGAPCQCGLSCPEVRPCGHPLGVPLAGALNSDAQLMEPIGNGNGIEGLLRRNGEAAEVPND